MVLIAGSIGAALYLLAGFHAAESTIVAVAVLTGLAIYNAVAARLTEVSRCDPPRAEQVCYAHSLPLPSCSG